MVTSIPTSQGDIGFSETTGVPEDMTWTNEGYSGGQVCIKLKIAGENMPVNIAEMNATITEDYVAPTKDVNVRLQIYNRGVNDLTDVDVSYAIDDNRVTTHIDAPNPIKFNDCWDAEMAMTVSKEGVNIPVSFSIDKVNGQEINPLDKKEQICFVHSFSAEKGFPHNIVVEEAGGSGCGWCVRGIVGLEKTYEAHPDGSFIPISAHSIGYGVETNPVGYDEFWNRYITHNPSCLINRDVDRYGIADPNHGYLEYCYQKVTSNPAMASVEVSGYEFNGNSLTVESDVVFALDESDAEYAVAYVVTEDNVGPYMQANSYSGLNEDMDGWEDLPGYVETYYDFLARGISDFYGSNEGFPTRIESGVKYHHVGSVPLDRVVDRGQLHVVAMLINCKTECIENGTRLKLTDVDSVEILDLDDTHEVEFFDLWGHRIQKPEASGIYIMRQGGKSRKIYVR